MTSDIRKVAPVALVSRVLAARDAHAHMAYLVPSASAAAIIGDLVSEMGALDDAIRVRVVVASSAPELLTQLEPKTDLLVVSAGGFTDEDWRRIDRQRSALARQSGTVFVMGEEDFVCLMRVAPHLASWFGGAVFAIDADGTSITDEQRKQRLVSLRAWSGKTDDEVLVEAQRRSLPRDPEYAEWLVLLGRGDLVDGE